MVTSYPKAILDCNTKTLSWLII